MIIEKEGIVFSSELYLNYLHQFGKREAKKYVSRTLTFEDIIRTSLDMAIANQSLIIATNILNKTLNKK